MIAAARRSQRPAPTETVDAGHVLSGTEFVAVAREQIATIDELLARHVDRDLVCSCGRATPCPQATSMQNRREQFTIQLRTLEATAIPPMVAAPVRVRGQAPIPGSARTTMRQAVPPAVPGMGGGAT
jgi:hypothetical protein